MLIENNDSIKIYAGIRDVRQTPNKNAKIRPKMDGKRKTPKFLK